MKNNKSLSMVGVCLLVAMTFGWVIDANALTRTVYQFSAYDPAAYTGLPSSVPQTTIVDGAAIDSGSYWNKPSATFPGKVTANYTYPTYHPTTATFMQFDHTLGSLRAVNIRVSMNSLAWGSVVNSAASANSLYSVEAGTQLFYTLPYLSEDGDGNVTNSAQLNVYNPLLKTATGADNVPTAQVYSGGQAMSSLHPMALAGSGGTAYIGSASGGLIGTALASSGKNEYIFSDTASTLNQNVLDAYVGTGTFDYAPTALAWNSSASSISNLTLNLNTKSATWIEIAYTYDTIPEPSTYILLGISLGCVGLVRYRMTLGQAQQTTA